MYIYVYTSLPREEVIIGRPSFRNCSKRGGGGTSVCEKRGEGTAMYSTRQIKRWHFRAVPFKRRSCPVPAPFNLCAVYIRARSRFSLFLRLHFKVYTVFIEVVYSHCRSKVLSLYSCRRWSYYLSTLAADRSYRLSTLAADQSYCLSTFAADRSYHLSTLTADWSYSNYGQWITLKLTSPAASVHKRSFIVFRTWKRLFRFRSNGTEWKRHRLFDRYCIWQCTPVYA